MQPTSPPSDLAQRNEVLSASNLELRLANESLVFAAARYLALHDLAPVALVTVDSDGTLVDVNDAAAVLFGVPRDELVGRALRSLLVGASCDRLIPLLADLFATSRRHGVELTAVRDSVPVEIMIDAIVLPGTGPTRAVLACVDVTLRKQADAARQLLATRAEEAQRLESLGVLASGIAHDFNNLMTVVLAGADTVLLDLGDGTPHAKQLVEIRRAAKHAGALAHQMLAYSGHISVPVRPVNVVALIRELEPLIRAAAHSTPVLLELSESSLYVSGDEPQLQQVVLNLVCNAAESMLGRPGAVVIAARTDPAGESVVVDVCDLGLGIDAQTKKRIFDPYFSTKFAGRGLGLAVVHGVVRGHRGAITVTSTPGVGTTFTIQLPRVAAVGERSRAQRATDGPLAGTVLLVDDDASVSRTLSRMLAKLGMKVLVAESGERALEMVRDQRLHVDLVLTDLTMPGMDGVALALQLRLMHPELPIVLVTGYGRIPEGTAHVFAGALTKPFDLAAIRAAIQPFLGVAPDGVA